MAFNFVQLETQLTVVHEEIDGSPVIVDTENAGFSATRTLQCKWEERLLLVDQLRGAILRGPSLTTRIVPHRFPEFSDALCQEARAVRWGGMTSDVGVIPVTYEAARVIVIYKVPDGINIPSPDARPEDVLVTESIEPSAEFITVPNEGLFWPSSPTEIQEKLPDDITVTKLLSKLDWVYTIHQEQDLPKQLLKLIGRVNEFEVSRQQINQTFPAESLLFASLHAERQVTTEGTQAWRLTFRFTFNPFETDSGIAAPKTGWNLFLRSGNKVPRPLIDKDGKQVKPYERADFKELISF